MTRMLPAVMAVAALALGSPAIISLNDEQDETTRLKLKEEWDARQRRHHERMALRRSQEQRHRDELIERQRKLEAGIDPTNDRPLSRQQRRWIARKGQS